MSPDCYGAKVSRRRPQCLRAHSVCSVHQRGSRTGFPAPQRSPRADSALTAVVGACHTALCEQEARMSVTYGVLSTYPPTQCGLATFSEALVEALTGPADELRVVAVVDEAEGSPRDEVFHQLVRGAAGASAAAANALNGCDVAIVQHEYGIFGGRDGARRAHGGPGSQGSGHRGPAHRSRGSLTPPESNPRGAGLGEFGGRHDDPDRPRPPRRALRRRCRQGPRHPARCRRHQGRSSPGGRRRPGAGRA